MKRTIVILVAVPVVAWVLVSLSAAWMERSVAARPWPRGLGNLDTVPARYPERAEATPAAVVLTRLASPLGVDVAPRAGDRRVVPPSSARKDFDAVKAPLTEYINAQLLRPSGQIDAPRPLLIGYFAGHGGELDAVRAHLLSGEPIAWRTQLSLGPQAPIPNLLGHMELARLFVADALIKARNGDAAGWDDLHALWLLDAGLRSRPDLISQLIALASARMMNAAAAKLPLPEPPWFAEVRAVDYPKSIVASMQAEAWSWMHSPRYALGGWLASPYIRICAANSAEQMRAAFSKVATSNACDVSGQAVGETILRTVPRWNIFGRIAIPNIASVWQRAARVVPELELTQKVLQLRSGETPSPFSRCSDGQWLVAASSLKFSRALTPPKTGINYPLEYAALDLR